MWRVGLRRRSCQSALLAANVLRRAQAKSLTGLCTAATISRMKAVTARRCLAVAADAASSSTERRLVRRAIPTTTTHLPIRIAVCLSGGVDSSVVATMLSRYRGASPSVEPLDGFPNDGASTLSGNGTEASIGRRGFVPSIALTAIHMRNWDAAYCDLDDERAARNSRLCMRGTTSKSGRRPATSACEGERDEAIARHVASSLGIPFKVIDLAAAYWRDVFLPLLDAYRRGETLNADVVCNTKIKFGVLAAKLLRGGGNLVTGDAECSSSQLPPSLPLPLSSTATAAGYEDHSYDFIATGHYVRVVGSDFGDRRVAELVPESIREQCNERYKFSPWSDRCVDDEDEVGVSESRMLPSRPLLGRAASLHNDQSGFLACVPGNRLAKLIAPLGWVPRGKKAVREYAEALRQADQTRAAFSEVATKPTSTGLCFVGTAPFKRFLRSFIPPSDPFLQPGEIWDVDTNAPVRGMSIFELGNKQQPVSSRVAAAAASSDSAHAIVLHEGLALYTRGERIDLFSTGGKVRPTPAVRSTVTGLPNSSEKGEASCSSNVPTVVPPTEDSCVSAGVAPVSSECRPNISRTDFVACKGVIPFYVVRKDRPNNRIFVARGDPFHPTLFAAEFSVRGIVVPWSSQQDVDSQRGELLNLLDYLDNSPPPVVTSSATTAHPTAHPPSLYVSCRIREPPIPCAVRLIVHPDRGDRCGRSDGDIGADKGTGIDCRCSASAPRRALTTGQAAVFFLDVAVMRTFLRRRSGGDPHREATQGDNLVVVASGWIDDSS